ncbi:lipopolysaccharide biosynthesis protein [Chitinophaga oryzae]|uniref:Lipopolysaccharide biosynthesis protein n=1 Tax=Chitinophaga oryzae TaxID=2725414 RepID=A0AAE6ZJZ9_9BACT|nr:Wzz/FepE/Etk N-terminal domain-containing protein [Chitinophaga oryzae]QJB34117.1 lipopolysaccharide biosynthesis protein [Chitinophaga oryzae]QJB40637.1 lipopolysaccharide biosynthesis protein [Chitinophaga oryzae]
MGGPHTTTNAEKNKFVEEISFKDLILKLKEFSKYIWRKKIIVILSGLIGGGLGLTAAFMSKPTYKAELSFVLEESNSNPLGAYMGIASQFGLDLGGKGGSGLFEGDNIMEFLRSRLMIEKALLSAVTYDNKQSTLAELYMDAYKTRQGWEKDSLLKKVSFPLNADRSSFSRQQDSVLNTIQGAIATNHLNVARPDKKLSFIVVGCTTLNETFSKEFVETLVREATRFYIETKTKRSTTSVDRLQAQADSMEVLLNRKTYETARVQDINQNPARQVANVKSELVMRDKVVLQTMYAEVVKNLEISKIAMAQDMPVIQIVDKPILPLDKRKFGKLKGIALGGILGGMLCVLVLIGNKVLREELA